MLIIFSICTFHLDSIFVLQQQPKTAKSEYTRAITSKLVNIFSPIFRVNTFCIVDSFCILDFLSSTMFLSKWQENGKKVKNLQCRIFTLHLLFGWVFVSFTHFKFPLPNLLQVEGRCNLTSMFKDRGAMLAFLLEQKSQTLHPKDEAD